MFSILFPYLAMRGQARASFWNPTLFFFFIHGQESLGLFLVLYFCYLAFVSNKTDIELGSSAGFVGYRIWYGMYFNEFGFLRFFNC